MRSEAMEEVKEMQRRGKRRKDKTSKQDAKIYSESEGRLLRSKRKEIWK